MKEKRGAKRELQEKKDRGVSIPVSVIDKKREARGEKNIAGATPRVAQGSDRPTDSRTYGPTDLHLFSGHRHVNILAPIFAAQPKAFKDSMMREIVPARKLVIANISFSSIPELKKSLGDRVCRSCMEDEDYGIPESLKQNLPNEALHLAIPREWLRSATRLSGDRHCPATASLSHLSISPRMQLHSLRHAYAHVGGWSSLESEDRLRVAHAIQQRLASSDRIRFAHVEHVSNHAERIREYWAELLAFALSISAEQEAEWKRIFLSRAVQRGAGAPLAYPMPETGEKDLQLVRWYFDQVNIQDPWTFASNADEWIRSHEREDRASRVRYAISGFPPGKMRMIFSIFIEADPMTPDVAHQLSRLEMGVPDHLATWVEQACVFADHVGSMNGESDEASLLSESAVLAAGLERFSEADQQKALKAVQEYIHQKVNAL